MINPVFLDISLILVLTVSIAYLMRLLHQPLVVAYILAGIAAGPVFLNLVHAEQAFFDVFAQFGILLLLFIIGLSLNIPHIKAMGKNVAIGGLIQFFVSVGIGYGAMTLLGFSSVNALFVGVAVSFASTIIVSKLLTDKKHHDSVYGRYTIGVLLLQDILAIGIMIFLGTMSQETGSWAGHFVGLIVKGALLFSFIAALARYVLPKLLAQIANSGELLFLFTISWCFGVSSLLAFAGFTPEIGAITAGISLGASPFQPEIASRIRPLRDFFLVIFFIVLGSHMQLGNLEAALLPAALLSLVVLVIHPLVLYGIMRRLSYTRRNAFLAATTAAQVSEFGFILLFAGQALGMIDQNAVTVLTLVALVTIVLSTYLITHNETVFEWLRPFFNFFGKDQSADQTEKIVHYPVWIFGYHRIGWRLGRALTEASMPYGIVDFDPESVERAKQEKAPVYFGDASDVEFLESLPLVKATMIVSTLPELEDQRTLISHVRRINRQAFIIANSYDSAIVPDLYRAGADYVMMPHLLGGAWISEILTTKKWSRQTFRALKHVQTTEMKKRFQATAH